MIVNNCLIINKKKGQHSFTYNIGTFQKKTSENLSGALERGAQFSECRIRWNISYKLLAWNLLLK
jgi:hypothetical protein